MTKVELKEGPGRTIRQARSRKSYKAFIEAGFALLEDKEFEDITIAGIAREAGYSVGAFYARFASKDEFLDAMIAYHIEERSGQRDHLLDNEPHETLIESLIDGLVNYYWKRRGFWRAVLMRSTTDPELWAPIRVSAQTFVARLTERIQRDSGRALTPEEEANIRFAIHMVLGVVNNRIVNRPSPSLYGSRTTLVANLTRAFRLVSDYDNL